MPEITRTEIIDYRSAAEDRKVLGREKVAEILPVLFEGPAVETTRQALLSGALQVFQIALWYDRERLVGFALIVHDELDHQGQLMAVARAITGLMPAYRGRQHIAGFFLRAALHVCLHYRDRPLWAFFPVVHVSSYRSITQNYPRAVPHPEREVTEEQRALIEAMALRFRCERAPGDHPLVCRRAMWVRGARDQLPQAPREEDALDRHFYTLNPHYAEGGCVMTLLELKLSNLPVAAGKILLQRLRRRLRGLLAPLVTADALPQRLG